MIIHIDGLISSGKSTFCSNINKKYPKTKLFLEPSFKNPFLNDFYSNPKEIGYKIEKYLIDYRSKIYIDALNHKKNGYKVIIDGSIYKSLYFIEHNYKLEKNLSKIQYEKITIYLNDILKHYPFPDKIVILDKSPKCCLESIKNRYTDNKKLECEKLIKLSYLKNSKKSLDDWVTKMKSKTTVIRYDWENFDSNYDINAIYKEILKKVY